MTDNDPKDASGRRDFLGTSIAGTATALGVMAGYPVVRFLSPKHDPARRVATAGEAVKFLAGTAKTVLLGDRPVLVIRLEDGTFRAYSALCTHLQCIVGYSTERRQIECPCHRGVYSVEGANISGPPPRPLEKVSVQVVHGIVTLSEV